MNSGFKRFTNPLYTSPVKMVNIPVQKMFRMSAPQEIFYSIKNGDWDDLSIWETLSGRRTNSLPTANDDVYIRNTITITGSATPFSCNNLFISGILNIANRVLNIYGNFKNRGIINSGITAGVGTNYSTIKLYGVENILGVINQNNGTDIQYARDGVQYIQPFNYYRLSTAGTGVKYLTSNTVVLENLILTDVSPIPYINGVVNLSGDRLPIFECAGYELEVYGQTLINQWAIFKQSGSGRLKFRGFVGVGYGLQYPGGFLLPGNPNVELQNGFYMSYDINLGYGLRGGLYSGTGTWTFTTNNQNIGTNIPSATNFILDCPILIDDGITLTVSSPFTIPNSALYLNNTINGVSSTSQLINKSNLYFNSLASVSSMTTGIFNITTFANTIGYVGNYSATIPSYFTTFHNLTIGGTGTKTLGVNTTVNNTLNLIGNNVVGQAGILECSTYNLSVFGQTLVGQGGGKGSTLSKNGAGNLLFVGLLDTDNLGGKVILSGNPNVEMRGGINSLTSVSLTSGTGTWTFTTNNQNINGGYALTFNCNIIVDGAISVTNNIQVNMYGTLNGTNANSKWVLNNILDLYNSTTPFSTLGTLDYTTNTSASIGFRFNGNFTLPATTFQGLRIGGTGTKTLSGNTLIQQSLYLLGNPSLPGTEGILECSSYNLQVNALTAIGGFGSEKGATFSKNGAGSLLLIGNVTTSNGGDKIQLTGNPTIEFRNGFNVGGGVGSVLNFGTGNMSFTTNNQTFTFQTVATIQNNITISGAITLTTGLAHTISGIINGDNASSKLLCTSTLTYQSATQPMATGILDTSTNLNTWIYGLNNQDIKGGPTTLAKQVYRNLTLNGTGTKTLTGYVSVLNTYTLTSPATLALNGYTLTNP